MKLNRILPSVLLSLLLIGHAPVVALAADTGAATAEVTPSPSASPEPKLPDKPGYVYNDTTGKWEASDLGSFSWDVGLDRWVSPLYRYDPQVGWYHVAGTSAPAATPAATPDAAPQIASATAGTSSNEATASGASQANGSGSSASNANTGPGSTNNSAVNNANTLLANATTLANITNTDISAAISGAANVSTNTYGGNATTGAASVVANYLNLLSSMWSWGTGGLSTFVMDIFGDHVGDINIDVPAANGGGGSVGALSGCGSATNSSTGPLSTNSASTNCANNTTVNNQANGSIVNNIDLNAKSGAANVEGNMTAGDAVSGDATASLNIINLINSSIGAGRSFFGMINIYGNLDGDILFPGLSLDDAIAGSASGSSASNNNTGAGSSNNATATNANAGTVNNNATGAFNNNIDASAKSGDANVSNNTNAGSAITGTADTNTNTFNLFNTDIFGDNAVLVLINDMGHWVGRIMNLPGGSSGGALLTSNATVSNNNTGAGSSNNASTSSANSGTLNNSSSGSITNNVNANAQSGDANVQNNTNAGDARSGNARVATNIANIFGSHLSFGKVFGILIVNVFGSWTGSVGVDTPAGNSRSSDNSAHALSAGGNLAVTANPLSRLGSSSLTTASPSSLTTNEAQSGGSLAAGNNSSALGTGTPSGTTVAATTATPTDHTAAASQAGQAGWMIVGAAGLLLAAGALGAMDRRKSRPSRR